MDSVISQPPACRVVRSEAGYTGEHGISYFSGVSAENAGTRGLCMHLLTMPPGLRAKAHKHEQHETAIYVLSGEAEMWFGEHLENYVTMRAGDFVYIPAGMPHLPANPSATEPCTAVIARTDPNAVEGLILLPDLEEDMPHRIEVATH